MRLIALSLLAATMAAPPALAQGSLKDFGKAVLEQQTGGGGVSLPSSGTRGQGLSTGDIASGLKEALRIGTEKVSSQLGRADGYNRDPAVHIPLPDSLQKVQAGLKMAGMSGLTDDLELKLNRAAEAAAPEAKRIFWNALEKMSLDDAKAILNGPSDAATQYFKRTMTPDLKTAMRPVVDKTVSEAGAVKSYESLTASAKGLPMVGDGRAMLTDHVLDGGLKGLFTYLGREEAAIRSDPTKRTSDILRKVFAN
ncbi:conserved exported hypothetical protein [Magnetospirillum sp. LM-5]|uniref:DUF4197 domain-containing protein n=1 Tax=Magnetospirillum sp. LM-5 TaxID=2681466 RepID=UPI001381E340|nr:DUF4197 domain-containing protein [Magnetospirillum sp. LM-5]CAA7611354.1 conserved exported hypothetical protein [Magnetospirillum sp. LM-5]